MLANYVTTPGGSATRVVGSPFPTAHANDKETSIKGRDLRLAKDGLTLVIVLHPQCPCSATSMDNLSLIMQKTHKALKAYAVFVRPSGFSESWTKSKLWKQATQIPNVVPVVDNDGQIAKELGAMTSGQTYLYNAEGEQLFAGGVTWGRGHAGDNEGMDYVISTVNGVPAAPTRSAVYGCSLFSCSASNNPSTFK